MIYRVEYYVLNRTFMISNAWKPIYVVYGQVMVEWYILHHSYIGLSPWLAAVLCSGPVIQTISSSDFIIMVHCELL